MGEALLGGSEMGESLLDFCLEWDCFRLGYASIENIYKFTGSQTFVTFHHCDYLDSKTTVCEEVTQNHARAPRPNQ